MNYATGYAMNVNDIFLSFPTKKMKMTSKACEELIGNRHKEVVAKNIFKSALSLVINDIIDNNATFILPTASKSAQLGMKRFDRERFSDGRRRGKWQDIDFIATNFSAYQMAFRFQTGGVQREKLIYLNSENRDKIVDNVNNGKQYF